MQAMILAGGAGTRLRSVLGDNLNKPMAPIGEKPFLEYLITRLRTQGVDDIVLCVGYKGDVIHSYFGHGDRWGVRLTYSHEADFLGTGGALKLAERHVRGDAFLALNGDSFFDVDLRALAHFHATVGATATLALARVENAERYGTVRVDDYSQITGFAEKVATAHAGLINAGIYVLNREVLAMIPGGSVCSIEHSVFPALVGHGLFGYPSTGFFIDIGVPTDYARLQADPSPLFATHRKRR